MVVFSVWGICIWDVADVGVFRFGICVWDVADVGVFRFGTLLMLVFFLTE